MKNYLLLIITAITVLSGCSKSDVEQYNPPLEPQIEEASTSTLVEFGTFLQTDTSKLMSATVYNNTGAALAGPATLSTSDFSFVAGFNCPGGAKVKTSCSAIKLNFNPQGKNPGEYNATLNLGSISVPLHATVSAPVVVSSASYTVLSSVVTSLDFGRLSGTQSVMKTITVKNTGSATANGIVQITPSNMYTVSFDTCSNKDIAKKATCSLKISLSATGKDNGFNNATVSYLGSTLALTGEIFGYIPPVPNVFFTEGVNTISSYDFGQFYGNNSKQLTVNIKNTGTAASAISTATLNNSNFAITYNTCSNISIPVNGSCQVRITFSAAGKTDPNYAGILYFGDKNLNLTASFIGPISVSPGSSGTIDLQDSGSIVSFSVTGGLPPYQYSVISSTPIGSVFNNNVLSVGLNNTAATTVQEKARIQDSLGQFKEVTYRVKKSPGSDVQVYVEYPQSGRIISSDGKINCGNNNYDCDIMYKSSQTLQLTMQDIASNYILQGLYNYGDSYDELGTGPSFSFSLDNKGGYVSLYPQMQEDFSGIIDVVSPSSGVIQSSDGNIKCGNGFNQCSYTYDKQAVPTVNFSISGISSNYILQGLYNYGDSYDEFGTGPNFSVSTNAYVFIYAQIIEIPSYKLSLKIRGGSGNERISVSIPDNSISEDCEGLCSYLVQHGKSVQMQALSNGGETFIGWKNCPQSNGNICSFSINSAGVIEAEFQLGYNTNLTEISNTELIPGGEKLFIGDSAYYEGSDYNLYYKDLKNPSSAQFIRSTGGSRTQIAFLGPYNNKALYSEHDYDNQIGKLYILDGNTADLITTKNECRHFRNSAEVYKQGNKLVYECMYQYPNYLYKYSVYLVDLVSKTDSLIYQADVRDFHDTYLLNYDFTNEIALFYEKNFNNSSQRRIMKVNNQGQVIKSLQTNNFENVMTMNRPVYNNKLFSMFYASGTFNLYSIDLSLDNAPVMITTSSNLTVHLYNNKIIIPDNGGNIKLVDITNSQISTISNNLGCSYFQFVQNSYNRLENPTQTLSGAAQCQNGQSMKEFHFDLNTFAATEVYYTPLSAQPPKVHDFVGGYLTSVDSYYYGPIGQSAKPFGGSLLLINSNNVRYSRDIWKFNVSQLQTTGQDVFFTIINQRKLSNGNIYVEYFVREYPSGSETNRYYRLVLSPK